MRAARLSISASYLLGLALLAPLPLAGCDGKGADDEVAKVTPEFQKKTSDMLNQKSKDMMEKYKKSPGKR